MVGLSCYSEQKRDGMLAENARKFIRLLLWCQSGANEESEDFGPFESSNFVKPGYVSLQGK